jgi:Tfp pilus assembly protein PilX
MKLLKTPLHYKAQQGAAVLLVSIVLLLGVTLITIFAARVGVIDQRIAANEYRHVESQTAANAALDQAAAFLEENTDLYDANASDGWVDCTDAGFINDFPCKIIGTTITDTYTNAYDGNYPLTPTTIDPISQTVDLANVESNSYFAYKTGGILTAIGTGKSADGSGEAIAQISYGKSSVLAVEKLPPVLAPVVNLSGSFMIIADPQASLKDGADCTLGEQSFDFPVSRNDISVWTTTSDGANTGSWSTCLRENFVNASDEQCVDVYDDTDSHTTWKSCTCNSELSFSGGTDDEHINYDIRIPGRNSTSPFPSSQAAVGFQHSATTPFEYIFGTTSLTAIKAKADHVYEAGEGCAGIGSLNLAGEPFVYVTDDCSVGNVGTQDNPIFLVVEGDLTITANTDIWGIVLGAGEVTFNGSPIVHGSVVSNDPTKLTNGNYTQIFDWCVNNNLIDSLTTPTLSKVKYSWRNFKP